MTPMLTLFWAGALVELLLYVKPCWQVRRPLAAGIGIGLALVSGAMFGERPSLAIGLLALITLYRVVNLLRVVQNRSEEHYLRRTARETSVWLIAAQVGLLFLLAISDALEPDARGWWLFLAGTQLLVAAGILRITLRQLRRTQPLQVSEHFADSHLPALSVCIPARNESAELESCLRSLIASDYPKLEILVLDDCSQGPRTSDIIRSFAHDGVRFIAGKPAPTKWLAKNWAYQQLLQASSGKLVLFCGVDVHFEPASLRNMVTTMLAKEKRMVSVMPVNAQPHGRAEQRSLLIQPARYAWELCVPRRFIKRPPVLSSCWLAQRELLDGAGTFAAVAASISPEAFFARRALLRDGYSFMQSDSTTVITSHKSAADQWHTAVRTRYPQLHRKPQMVLLVSFAEVLFLVAPPVMALVAVLRGELLITGLSVINFALQSYTYGRIVGLTYRATLRRGFIALVPAVLLDIYIRHESLWRYEFGEITWKGRNVCLPVMRVISRMPTLPGDTSVEPLLPRKPQFAYEHHGYRHEHHHHHARNHARRHHR